MSTYIEYLQTENDRLRKENNEFFKKMCEKDTEIFLKKCRITELEMCLHTCSIRFELPESVVKILEADKYEMPKVLESVA